MKTYDELKTAYNSNTPVTEEQVMAVLETLRMDVGRLAIEAAVASGLRHAAGRLPNMQGENGANASDLASEAAKASRHLAKATYFYAKLQAGKWGDETPYVFQESPLTDEHGHGEEGEIEDEESDDLDDETPDDED